jgi:putative transcriptional regulator
MPIERLKSGKRSEGYLEGQMLVAMPSMGDERFARTVVYMCAHSVEGAWGIVVNRRSRRLTFPDLLVQLDVIKQDAAIRLPQRASNVQVLRGGPVERGRGFMLHTADYSGDHSTIRLADSISVTATLDILKTIAQGEGPGQAVLALGYAGWAPGQLDQELQSNGWLTVEADESFIFSPDQDAKYDRALKKIGIDPAMLSNEAGHA